MRRLTRDEVLGYAHRAGISLDEAELQHMWPVVERYLEGLERLRTTDLADEPAGSVFQPNNVGEGR
jgi:hypothetical protein